MSEAPPSIPARASIAPRELGAALATEFRPQPLIYWADLLASAAAGWGLFSYSAALPLAAPLTVLTTFFAAVALLRAGYFAHEIAHLSRRAVPGFEFVWHLLAGIPLMTPSLMIGAHKNHHRVASYGTARDPEYAPIASWGALRFAVDLLSMLVVPGLLILRWGVIGPVSFAIPPLRRLVDVRMSTLAINPLFERELPVGRELRVWRVQELCATAFVWSVAAAVWFGAISLALIGRYWLVLAVALVLNEVRTYVAHAYAGDGSPMTIDEQVNDTITLDGWFLITDILAPLGDRYHAAHHRYPSLPYHSLPAVHRRLFAGEAYRITFREGLSGALLRLVRRAGASAPSA